MTIGPVRVGDIAIQVAKQDNEHKKREQYNQAHVLAAAQGPRLKELLKQV